MSQTSVQSQLLTYPLRLHAPSSIRSNIRPGVPTTILVFVFFSFFIWSSLPTPPNTATLPIPTFFPSSDNVSCVWMANSRVGATISTDIPLASFPINRANAGIPNPSVFPLFLLVSKFSIPIHVFYLPVSAIPTTSFPAIAYGHVHA